MKNRISITVVLFCMLLATLACNLPTSSSPQDGAPDIPSIPVEAVEATLAAGLQIDPNSGKMNFTVTEQEMTSYLAAGLAQQSSSPISEPQILLRSGQIDLYGVSKQGAITVDVHIAMVPYVTADHLMQVTVTAAEFGPVTMPESVVSSLNNTINEALKTQYSPAKTGINAESVVIADGVMTLSGSPAQ